MRRSFEKMKREYEELKQLAVQELVKSDIENIDGIEFRAVQSALRLSNACFESIEAQISALERMEQKLDELLARK